MTLREDVHAVIKEVSEWYVDELKKLVEMMREEGIPIFTEPVPEKEARETLMARTDAEWQQLRADNPARMQKDYTEMLRLSRKSNGAT